MHETRIYISTDNRSLGSSEKWYGYVLECVLEGETYTKEGFGKITGTYHKAILTALTEALKRFREKSEITVCADNEYVLQTLEKKLPDMAANGFLTAKGEPTAHQEEWMQIWEQSQKHFILTEKGKHAYDSWIQDEIRKRKEKEEGNV